MSSDLEKAFSAIEKGKSEESSGHHWEAATLFGQARELLQDLASKSSTPNDEEEQAKIAKLYEDQSYEYLHRAREAFMVGLKVEHEQDVELAATTRKYACDDLSVEEAKERLRLFASVFAKKEILDLTDGMTFPTATTTAAAAADTTTTTATEQPAVNPEISLEERLQQLNANLPKSLKSSQERLEDVNKGMDRLGFSLPVAPLTFKPRKSAHQEVEDIIAQAQDQVVLERVLGDDKNDKDDDGGDSILSDDDDDDLHSNADSLLSDEVAVLQNVSQIRDQVAAAQAKLAELTALLEELPDDEDDDKEEKESDPAPCDPGAGKQKLQDAKLAIRKALRLWKVKAVER
ncbi:expressed unknown protein [Seminavis robusta]|uniref:Uncharacterized protein n=1 Tax=Seminavis robusta TaxID=568900 RepID=A0A9N8HFR0_9STRA|nr:expressed unknown protein [Seminavis robusta]|eukprot:Sro468_g149160.1 n/a (347) ;mRNA; f:40942-41982